MLIGVKQPTSGSARLSEIDVFRALAVCLMGMTHGLFWEGYGPAWTTALVLAGIYFCYPAFLLSFGMGVGILAARGGLDDREGRVRLARRALVVLLAYYLVAFGRYAPEIARHGGTARAARCLELLLLLDVPKAGSFFLSFALFLLLCALLGPALRTWALRRPAPALGAALVLHAAGYYLSGALASSASWVKLLFGAHEGPRTFPILPYAPLFAAGLLLGAAYREAAGKGRQTRGPARLVAIAAGMAALGFVWVRDGVDVARAVSPVPTLFYLAHSGALGLLAFAGCAAVCRRRRDAPPSPIERFLVFVGRNSIWIIAWQYVWIQLAARTLGWGGGSGLVTALYLLTMVFVPPLLLGAAQRLAARLRTGGGPRREHGVAAPASPGGAP